MNIPTRGRPTRRQPPHLRHSPTHRRRVRQRFLCIHEENWIGKIRRAFEGSEMVLGRRKCDSDSRFSRAYICQIFGGTCGDKRTLVSLPFLQYLFFSYSCWSGHWKEELLEGKELEFYKWEGDVPELLKDVHDKLNMLSEHWSRDDKNRCLKETTKAFRYMGQIVRLIVS
ncbi:hypothetical protein AAZX31_17G231800 [Glycine max]